MLSHETDNKHIFDIKLLFLPYLSVSACVLGAQKNGLICIETVLLSMHNIRFG